MSVDLLFDNDEKMLQIITGCFSGTGGGVPELGLGNAEVVVVYASLGSPVDSHTVHPPPADSTAQCAQVLGVDSRAYP